MTVRRMIDVDRVAEVVESAREAGCDCGITVDVTRKLDGSHTYSASHEPFCQCLKLRIVVPKGSP